MLHSGLVALLLGRIARRASTYPTSAGEYLLCCKAYCRIHNAISTDSRCLIKEPPLTIVGGGSLNISDSKNYTSLMIGTTTGSRSSTRRKNRRSEERMPSCMRPSCPGRAASISSSTRHLASSSKWL